MGRRGGYQRNLIEVGKVGRNISPSGFFRVFLENINLHSMFITYTPGALFFSNTSKQLLAMASWPHPWNPDWEAKLNQIDAILARNRAIVASWGFGEVPVATKEERDAEWKELQQNEPPHLGLGCPVPKDWKAGEDTEARKWQSTSLRKNMGLQVSKPRKANDEATNTAGRTGKDSSDEEEGRTGLGRIKKAKHAHKHRSGGDSEEGEVKSGLVGNSRDAEDDGVETEARATTLQEILTNVKEQPNLDKVESWQHKTAKAFNNSAALPDRTSASPSSNSVQEPSVKTSLQNGDLHESAEESSVRKKSKKSKKSKKRKLAEYTGAATSDVESDGKLLEVMESAVSGEHTGKSHTKETSSKQELVQVNKLFEEPTGEMKVGEKDVSRGTPLQPDAEAKAKMRQLARERLGSGSYSKNTGRAKVKSTNPGFAVNTTKEKKKKKAKGKGNFVKADFA